MNARAPLLSLLAVVLAVLAHSAGASSVRWYVIYRSLNESGNSPNIGHTAYTVDPRKVTLLYRAHIQATPGI